MLAAVLTASLTPQAAPLAILPILLSTLIAGRCASTSAALLHGACAWVTMVLGGGSMHGSSSLWHGMSVAWVVLLLIEDMAIIGRVGSVRRRIARRHERQ